MVFAPKYRRLAIYGEIKQDIGRILRHLCQQKGVEIIEAELCKDHVHKQIVQIGVQFNCHMQGLAYLHFKAIICETP